MRYGDISASSLAALFAFQNFLYLVTAILAVHRFVRVKVSLEILS